MHRMGVAAGGTVLGMVVLFACVGTDAASTGDPAANDAGGDSAITTTSDGGTDATTGADALVADTGVDAPPPRCDVTKPFGTALPVDGVSTGLDEDGISLSADELTAYFSRDGNGSNGQDLFIGTRKSITDPFTSVILDGYDALTIDYEPTVSADGLTLVFFSQRTAGTPPPLDLYQATRTSTVMTPFDPPSVIGTLQTGNAEVGPSLRADGKVLYFSSNRDPGQGFDVYRSARQGNGVFLAPSIAQQALLATVNSTADEFHSVISDDERTIYFSSTRTDVANMGLQDIYVARRIDTAMPFGAPKPISELNTADDEAPNWVSPDGCAIYFTTKRTGGAGGTDIYVARRPL